MVAQEGVIIELAVRLQSTYTLGSNRLRLMSREYELCVPLIQVSSTCYMIFNTVEIEIVLT